MEPQSPMARRESASEGRKNDVSSDSYEYPSDSYPPCKRLQSSGQHDEDYLP
jgi:hypothetical protein